MVAYLGNINIMCALRDWLFCKASTTKNDTPKIKRSLAEKPISHLKNTMNTN